MLSDLTSAPQSALSFRVMLNLPHVGWRVHQVLITPALVVSVASACGSNIFIVAKELGFLDEMTGVSSALATGLNTTEL